MKDYKDFLNKWSALSAGGKELRKRLLDRLHEEVKKSFDVITRITIEEISTRIGNKQYLEKTRSILEGLSAFSIFGGYLLYLVENNIDPEKVDLVQRESSKGIGRIWVSEQKKDSMKKMLTEIDPIISMFILKAKEGRMNQLFASFPETMQESYKDIALIDKFLNWAGHQGFLVGKIENEYCTNPQNDVENKQVDTSTIKEA